MSDTNANIATVSGGSSGFGAQICRHMLDVGYDVISEARRKPDWLRKNLYTVEAYLLEAPATVEEVVVAGRPACRRPRRAQCRRDPRCVRTRNSHFAHPTRRQPVVGASVVPYHRTLCNSLYD